MGKRILICDDVSEIRLLLRLALDPQPDLEVVGEAADGNEAVAKAAELRPDVVLLDINMPAKGGLDALREIGIRVPNARVIMFTGFEGKMLGRQARELGAVDYIEKGAPLEEIVRRIRAAANGG